MTTTEQRIAIAVFCGWNPNPETDDSNLGWGAKAAKPHWHYPHQLPDYYSDLNAIHEAEDNLNDVQQVQFCIELRRACFGKPNQLQLFYAYHSDARMRSEALIKTIETNLCPHQLNKSKPRNGLFT